MVETITMTTITERQVVHEQTNATNSIVIEPTAINPDKLDDTTTTTTTAPPALPPKTSGISSNSMATTLTAPAADNRSTYLNSDISLKPTSISAQITGILKGGKLWKSEQVQVLSRIINNQICRNISFFSTDKNLN